MSAPPHRRAAALRWVAVVCGAALLVTGALVGRPAWSAGGGEEAPVADVLARAAASADVPFTGTATSTGSLGLPDLPRLGDVAALVGETTRTRTWWAGEQTWRTDVLTATGERGQYASGGEFTGWDYERDAITTGAALAGARLPRPSDLLPPALARSLLAGGTAPEGASALGERVVAGRLADGVRLRPTAEQADRTTLDHVDLWVDRASGLPLAVDLVDVVGGPVLSSTFVDVSLGAPDPAALVVPAPEGASVRSAEVDVAAGAAQAAPWVLPDQLAGLPALQDPRTTGAVAYGTGLLRLAVVSLPADQGRQALRAARAAGADPVELPPDASGAGSVGAQTALVRAGALTAAVVVDGEGPDARAHLVSGPVQPEVLAQAVAQLVTEPLEARS